MVDEIRANLKAGIGSQQIVTVGMTPTEAHRLIDDRIAREFGEIRDDVRLEINDRLRTFGDRLVAGLVKADRLDAARDPSLWGSIQAAAVEAGGSENDRDIDMLVDLLVERASDSADRRRRAVVDAAIKAIASLDDETLDAITALYVAVALDVKLLDPLGLPRLQDAVLSRVLPAGPPSSRSWIEHAILLGLARTVPGLRSFEEITVDRLAPSLGPGVPSDGPDYEIALAVSAKTRWPFLARQHSYKPDHSVSVWRSLDQIRDHLVQNHGVSATEAEGVAEEVGRVWMVGQIDPESRDRFLANLRELPRLVALGEWMGALVPAVTLTEVGSMVGLVNLRRLAPGLCRTDAAYAC
ncbi:hypothetical protein H5398_16110 [Tessaracoccus sp. MC1679]|uniref:LPO_1073/Vpar_1526 family protein n=1 Tax=Tessaracoccus sp. MC1679 TaxID=2760313 RepID=UPI0015FF610F|nr:LPO_1073/Vpar_1526 family protein [Tessaracoccus sp. MC1679]MBB1517475.1 hypothetical protein [Tessaracoccus sp. MC1679]